jgi:hypothetical protein|tara:strand:+ start:629 stop:772 length:144 start_codon:yes stop_codon:yes gene_type:complete
MTYAIAFIRLAFAGSKQISHAIPAISPPFTREDLVSLFDDKLGYNAA